MVQEKCPTSDCVIDVVIQMNVFLNLFCVFYTHIMFLNLTYLLSVVETLVSGTAQNTPSLTEWKKKALIY